MEAIFLHFIVEVVKSIVYGIDSLFEKSLKRAIPDLNHLLQNPQEALDHKDILIGPRRKYFSRTLIGIALSFAAAGPCILIILIFQSNQPQPISPSIWLGTLVPVSFVGFYFGFRLIRGGYCVIRDQGVEFTYRKRVVHCSWAVFNSHGRPMDIQGSNLILLPISPHATDSIMELNKEEGTALATGLNVVTPQWDTRSPFEAAVRPLYVVKIRDIGNLLLRIGSKFATKQPDLGNLNSSDEFECIDSPSVQRRCLDLERSPVLPRPQFANSTLSPSYNRGFPVAFQEKNGWIRMSLTRYYLPYHCCYCTIPTNNTFLFHVRNQADGEHYPIHLPTCDQCCDKARRRKRNLNLWRLGLPLSSVLALVLFFDNGQPLLTVLLMALPLFTLAILWVLTERISRVPVKVRYSPKKGSLHLRFRNSDYEKLVLAQRVSN